jgi:hypothetical protein
MLFELRNRRALSEFILVAILILLNVKKELKIMSSIENGYTRIIEDIIFGSFHKGKALQYLF